MFSLFIWRLQRKWNGARIVWSYLSAWLNLKKAVDVIVVSTLLPAKCGRCWPINGTSVCHFNFCGENFTWHAINDSELRCHPSLGHKLMIWGISLSFLGTLRQLTTGNIWNRVFSSLKRSRYLYFLSFTKRFGLLELFLRRLFIFHHGCWL
jgi:hypothetical protein